MSQRLTVSNSSPIIALDRIGRLDLLHTLFESVNVPSAVLAETKDRTTLPDWIIPRTLSESIGSQMLQASLGSGESETIALAIQMKAGLLLLDDRPARDIALAIGLPVAGTLSVLVRAKRLGIISVVGPEVDSLVKQGFRLSDTVLESILREAGEWPG